MIEHHLHTLDAATERLRLAALDPSHAPQVLEYFRRNAEFRQPWSPVPPADFLTPEHQRTRLEQEWTLMDRGHSLRWWVFGRDDADLAAPLGFVALSNIVRGAFQSCHLGYEMDGAQLNRGYVTEALRPLIATAFERLLLHRIEANIMPRNARSIRVAEKLGFSYEGLSPRYLRINGVWEDHSHYALLNAALE
ncbi:MAG TPA: GNAT family protein [Herpetosiphonaceae bacterium]|nr:GNAT family protein [Herpetosiphonaceae bacterium]